MSALPRTVDLDGPQQQIIRRLYEIDARVQGLLKEAKNLRAQLPQWNDDEAFARMYEIVESVARYSRRYTATQILGKRRFSALSMARQLAMYLVRQATGFSYPRIGAFFGRDHSTVIHACQQIERRMAAQPAFAKIVRDWGKQTG